MNKTKMALFGVLVGVATFALLCIFLLIFQNQMTRNTQVGETTEQSSNTDEENTEPITTEYDVRYNSGVWTDKDWENTYGTYLGDVVPDGDTAVKIASDILYNIDWARDIPNTVPSSVFYDEEDGIWIVYFELTDPDDPEMIFLGGGYLVAIQKKDGKILRIFADQ